MASVNICGTALEDPCREGIIKSWMQDLSIETRAYESDLACCVEDFVSDRRIVRDSTPGIEVPAR